MYWYMTSTANDRMTGTMMKKPLTIQQIKNTLQDVGVCVSKTTFNSSYVFSYLY